jgi:hypothetical protein
LPSCSKLLVEHNLFGKMVSIFPDHALAKSGCDQGPYGCEKAGVGDPET